MNQKYTISFTLLVLLFFIHVDADLYCPYPEQYCFPSGQGCNNGYGDCGAQIVDASWGDYEKPQDSPLVCTYDAQDRYTYLKITVSVPDSAGSGPEALGHFTFSDDDGNHGRILYDGLFLNGVECPDDNNKPTNKTYTALWLISRADKPNNVWADIWVSIYWGCKGEKCASEDVHKRLWVP
ncbi:1861_t:CDS:2 [Gigaspora margarita]|uniref:1861_t:CDS:1 n=1 Tax=Gigaspora margarita TaxID=4874 RepID=A0ABM8W0I7_GIGMA|nr:1861_t:CDS:2 [Gigaspora margarita]